MIFYLQILYLLQWIMFLVRNLMKIIHVEDHPLFSDGLGRLLIQLQKKITLVQLSSIDGLLEMLPPMHDIDLVLLDLYMPEMNGVSILKLLREKGIIVPVAFLSASTDMGDIKQCIEAGSMGFIPKSLPSHHIIDAIISVVNGNRFLLPEHANAIKHASKSEYDGLCKQYGLSSKQVEILKTMMKGSTNKEIAKHFCLSESAVKYHVGILFQSFNVKNRVECLHYAEKTGFFAGARQVH